LGRTAVSSRAAAKIVLKKKNQKQLDDYAEELHCTRPVINKTLYQLYDLLASCRKSKAIKYSIKGIETKGEEYAENIISLLEQYEKHIPQIGYDYHNNVWYGYNNLDTSYQNKLRLEADLKSLSEFISKANEINCLLKKDIGIICNNINSLYQCNELLDVLKTTRFITPCLLEPNLNEETLPNIKEMNGIANKIILNKQEIESEYDKDIYKLDGIRYYKILSKRYNKIVPRLFSKEYKKIISELRLCKSDGKRISYKKALQALKIVMTVQDDMQSFELLEKNIKPTLSKGYISIETDWEDLMSDYMKVSNILKRGFRCDRLAKQSKEEYFKAQTLMEADCDTLSALINKYSNVVDRLNHDFDIDCFNLNDCGLNQLKTKIDACSEGIDQLESWCRFLLLLEELNKLGEKTYVDFSIENKVLQDEVANVYK
jgi:hypothetical protein